MTLIKLEIVGQYLSHLLFHNSYFALYAAVNQSKNKPACRLCICRLVFYRKNTTLLYLFVSSSLLPPLFYISLHLIYHYLSTPILLPSFLYSTSLPFILCFLHPSLFFSLPSPFFLSFSFLSFFLFPFFLSLHLISFRAITYCKLVCCRYR